MWREWKRYEVIIADNKRGREHQIQALDLVVFRVMLGSRHL